MITPSIDDLLSAQSLLDELETEIDREFSTELGQHTLSLSVEIWEYINLPLYRLLRAKNEVESWLYVVGKYGEVRHPLAVYVERTQAAINEAVRAPLAHHEQIER